MIDFLTIERIQSAAQIYDVVSDFITLRKRGVNFVGLCPFHEDKTPSFYVSPSKNICKCFACGEGGTPVHFIMKHEQLSYVDALKFLAKKYGIEVQETEMSEEQKQVQGDREAMFILNGFAQKTFSFNLLHAEEGQAIGLSYFRERNFREDIIKKFQLGYALNERDAFTKEALKSGYKKKYLEKTGLTIVGNNDYLSDRFRGRVIFPIHTLSGKIVAFGGRILKKEEKTAKYVNSPESEIYHKGNELYGIYFARQAIVKQDKCFLVEGYTDVISMHQAGIENVVASSGTALTAGQIRMIHRFTANVTVLYDGDSAGIKAAIRGIDLLLEAGLNIKIVLLPEGEDPDSFSQKQSASSFYSYIQDNETDFVQFKAGLLLEDAGGDPVKKAKIINEIVETIALIPEEIIRLVYVKECSRLLDMDEKVLVRNIAKRRQEKQLSKKKSLYPQAEDQVGELQSGKTKEHNDTGLGESDYSNLSAFPLDEYEKNILYFVIRYGEQFMEYRDEETQEWISFNVIQFVASDLMDDELVFQNPLHEKIMDLAYANWQKDGFVAEEYFRNHPDPEVSQFAVDISTSKYILSNRYTKQEIKEQDEKRLEEEKKTALNKLLLSKVPYEMFNYKNSILKHRENELNEELKIANQKKDFERQIELMKQLLELKEAHRAISQQLGERIIVKI